MIRWQGEPLCPRPDALEAQLAQRLGDEIERLSPMALEVQVRAPTATSYVLTLQTRSEAGASERTVELGSCPEAQRAALVLIATALHPGQKSAPPEPAPAPLPLEEYDSRWSLRARALMDLASVPELTGGPSVGVGYSLGPRVRLWADAQYLFARETGSLGAQRAQIDLFALSLGAAFLWLRGPWTGGPLAELEAGALRGKATEDAAGGDTAPWLAAWAGALVSYTRGRYGVLLSVAAGVPFMRPQFSVEGSDSDAPYTTRPATGRIALGLSLALGAKKSPGSGQ